MVVADSSGVRSGGGGVYHRGAVYDGVQGRSMEGKMIVIIAFLLMAAAVTAGVLLAEKFDVKYFVWLVMGSFVVGIGIGIAGAYWNEKSCEPTISVISDLYSGNNQITSRGTFFLGSGRIEETDYVFYWEKVDGMLKKKQVPMEQSVFIEDGNSYLKTIKSACNANFFIPGEPIYEFHVPQGSVTNIYLFQ